MRAHTRFARGGQITLTYEPSYGQIGRRAMASQTPTSTYDGKALLAMFEAALRLMEANVSEINRLNVFPVPDGDTGTNMYLTMLDIVSNTQAAVSDSAAETSGVMASAALDGGRGNSGVLLSQFFMGMSEALSERDNFGVQDFARTLDAASVHAYGGIGHPREGTILSVMRESAESARNADPDSLADLLDTVSDAALDSVTRTPSMPGAPAALRTAGLVDSGGYGFYVMLEGIRRHLNAGVPDLDETLTPPEGDISGDFLDEIEEEEFGYCTQFMVDVEGVPPEIDDIKSVLSELGDSPVVVGIGNRVRIHVHALDPAPVLEYGRGLGEVSKENVQNMDEQREQYSADRRAELSIEDVSVVAVVQGDGLEDVFRSFGVDNFISGGDSMNPSVGDLVRAIEDAPQENVVFLPNNPNILLAAQQAAERSAKNIRVVPSRTVVQGISTILDYDLTAGSLGDHAAEMEQKLGHSRTGEIFTASRDAEIDDVAISEGQYGAMLDRRMAHSADTLSDALIGLLQKADDDGHVDLVTLYWGDLIDEDEASEVAEAAENRFPDAEFEVMPGGQPNYHLFVSIE